MQIILFRESRGTARTIRIPNLAIALAAVLTVCSLLTSLYLGIRYLDDDLLSSQVIASWEARLDAQREEVQRLQAQTEVESYAVGRRLAGMQARLLRMEALGERITEMAALDKGEFRFDEPPALGGPDGHDELGDEPLRYAAAVDELARQIQIREGELEVLQSLLANRRFQAEVELAGRPVEKGWMSSAFGRRVDPFTGRMAWHSGVDFAGQQGSHVVAVAAGVVTFSGKRGGYGKLVEINHGGGYVTRYAHHSEVLVEVGDIVKKGEPIALIGSSGRATGPHVHFEVLRNGRAIDPRRYIARSR
jgi:murein DD-endopeptidase MepM/ murein hydrolase activator NlpD